MANRDLKFEDRVFSCEAQLKSGKKLHIKIVVGGLKTDNPTEYMNNVVEQLGEQEYRGKYNEFISSTLDNPWIRILVSNFNDITDDDFEPLKEKMGKTPLINDVIKAIKDADNDTLVEISKLLNYEKK